MERQSETSVMNQGQYTSTTYMVDMLLLPHCHAHRYLLMLLCTSMYVFDVYYDGIGITTGARMC